MMMFFTIGILAGFLILACVGAVWALWHLLPMAWRLGVGIWRTLAMLATAFAEGCREAHAANQAANQAAKPTRPAKVSDKPRQSAHPGWIERSNAWVDRANARLDARIAARRQTRA